MADYSAGSPVSVAYRLTDSNGSPVTSGVTATVTIYGPTGTSVYSAAATHLGAGAWGVTAPGSATTASGLYRAVAPTIAYGTSTLVNQTILFTVGLPTPAYKTLREILVGFYDELHDGLTGTATAPGLTTSLVDAARANLNLTGDEYVDSELLILSPNAVGDTNPVVVDNFIPNSGTFFFAPAITATTIGQPYLLCNLRGQGFPFRDVRNKILAAWRDLLPKQHVVDEFGSTTNGTYEIAVPAQWRDISDVRLRSNSSQPWETLAGGYYQFDSERRVVRTTFQHGSGLAVRIAGTIDYAEPAFLNSVVQVPYGYLRDRVLGELWSGSASKAEQQKAAVHLARAERMKPRG